MPDSSSEGSKRPPFEAITIALSVGLLAAPFISKAVGMPEPDWELTTACASKLET